MAHGSHLQNVVINYPTPTLFYVYLTFQLFPKYTFITVSRTAERNAIKMQTENNMDKEHKQIWILGYKNPSINVCIHVSLFIYPCMHAFFMWDFNDY